MTIKVGQQVTWKAGGKVSRLDGVKGKWVTGVVTEISDNLCPELGRTVTVRKHYKSIVPLGMISISDVRPA